MRTYRSRQNNQIPTLNYQPAGYYFCLRKFIRPVPVFAKILGVELAPVEQTFGQRKCQSLKWEMDTKMMANKEEHMHVQISRHSPPAPFVLH